MKRILAGFLAMLLICSNLGMNVLAAPATENESAEVGIMSTTENFKVDKTPDENGKYDGDYLIAVNNTGTVAAGNVEPYSVLDEEENVIHGYDETGKGLIDPASVLPELTVGTNPYENKAMSDTDVTAASVGSIGRKVLMTGDEVYTSVSCVCVAVGEYCTVWVPSLDPIMVDANNNVDMSTMKAYMKDLAAEFDSQYAKMITMFGDKSFLDEGNGGDGDGKTAIFCYDIAGDFETSEGSYIAGYFYGADLDLPFGNATGNNCDCIHIDSYQGMGRSADKETLTNLLRSKGTMVHELQHMIHFSLCREKESSFYTIKTPTWINEMFSAAAQHLCYGSSEGEGRIRTYNSSDAIEKGYPVTEWLYGNLDDYALVYLMSQYIRIQYEFLGHDGETIYKDAMNDLSNSNNDLLKIIADKLETTKEELLLDYRIALQLKNATGRYGFGGESWAETISSDKYYTGGTNFLNYYGSGVVVANTEAGIALLGSGADEKYAFAGVNTQETEPGKNYVMLGKSESIYAGGRTVFYEAVMPEDADVYYTTDGTEPTTSSPEYPNSGVTFNTVGTHTLRVLGVDPNEEYEDFKSTETIVVGKQEVPVITVTDSETDTVTGKTVTIAAAEGANIYYTTNGDAPTVNSDSYEEALTFNTQGTYTIKAIATKAGDVISDVAEQTIVVRKKVTSISMNEEEISLYTNWTDAKKTAQLTATHIPDDANSVTYEWASSDEDVATVSDTGLVTAVGTGTATITVEADGKTASCNVTVAEIVSEINVLNEDLSITEPGGTLALQTEIMPENAVNQNLIFSVEPSDRAEDVKGKATVNEEGVVTAIKNGVVKVTIKAEDVEETEGSGVSADVYITISNQNKVVLTKTETSFVGGITVLYEATMPEGAAIYYTTDGTEPTESSAEYPSEGVTFDTVGTHILKVLGVDPNGEYEDFKTTETIVVRKQSAPVITVADAQSEVITAKTVSIEAAEGADIYYTTNGDEPTIESTKYDEAITFDSKGSYTVKAIAAKAGDVISDVMEQAVVVRNKVTAVSLDKEELVLYTNIDEESKSVLLQASYEPEDVGEVTPVWSSSSEGVATVSSAGLVTPIAIGSTTITVKVDEKTASCEVTVYEIATDIRVLNEDLSIKTDGGTLKLQTKVEPQNAINKNLKFWVEPSDREGDIKGIAAVSDAGVVTAIKDGVVKINIATEDVEGKEGTAVSTSVYVTISGQFNYEQEYSPKVVETVVTLNKQKTSGELFTVLPVGETDVNYVGVNSTSELSGCFEILPYDDNKWMISLTENGRSDLVKNKTYSVPLIVTSSDEFEKSIKVKIADSYPAVTLSRVTINPNYPNRTYALQASSKSGTVAVLGLKDGKDEGFTQNFTYDEETGLLSLANNYADFVKNASGKAVLSGVVTVKLNGYVEKDMPITVRVSNAVVKLQTSAKSYNLNLTKMNADKTVEVDVIHTNSSNGKQVLDTITNVTLNENGGKNYTKVRDIVTVEAADGRMQIEFTQDEVKPGTYVIPVLVDSVNPEDGSNDFSAAKCSVKVVVKKITQMPRVTLQTKSVKLNKNLAGDVATIKVKSIDQHNAKLLGFDIEQTASSSKTNVDDAIELTYDEMSNSLKAVINGEPGCKKYVFKCTPIYEDINENGEVSVPTVNVTVNIIDKNYSVKLTQRGSVDVLNRDNTAITYIVKNINFSDDFLPGENGVKMVPAGDENFYTDTVLDATDYFEAPVINENGTVILRLREDAVITKKCKYAFRLVFTTKTGNEEIEYGKVLYVTPKQSTVKIKQSVTPTLYNKVSAANNTVAVNLYSNVGVIDSAVFNSQANAKLPKGLTVINDGDYQLTGVSFDGIQTAKKGTYYITMDVYMDGQMVEAPTSNMAGERKPAIYKLKVVIR